MAIVAMRALILAAFHPRRFTIASRHNHTSASNGNIKIPVQKKAGPANAALLKLLTALCTTTISLNICLAF